MILTSDVEWDPYCDSYSAAETRCTSSVRTDTLPGEKVKVDIPHIGVVTTQGAPQELLDTMEVCAASRYFPPELSPLSENVWNIYASVNIASDDTDGDGLKGWRDSSVADIVSTQNRGIMALGTTNKVSVLTKEILAKR